MFTSKDGEDYPLTTTSPAMLRRIFEQAWQDQLADQAAAKIGVDAIDLSHAVAAVKNKHLDRKDRSLLISFLTQSIWALCRLKEAGYETETTCICGAPTDHITHRLLECPATKNLREEYLVEGDVEAMSQPEAFATFAGFPGPPPFRVVRPKGLGLDATTFWSRDGKTPQEVFVGEVYVDGSVAKDGHPWFHAPWLGTC